MLELGRTGRCREVRVQSVRGRKGSSRQTGRHVHQRVEDGCENYEDESRGLEDEPSRSEARDASRALSGRKPL